MPRANADTPAAEPADRQAEEARGAQERRHPTREVRLTGGPARRARPRERRAQILERPADPGDRDAGAEAPLVGRGPLVGPDVRVAKPGDRVLFLPSSGLEVELEGEELVLLRERDVQAVLRPAAKADRQPGQYL